MKLGKKDLRNTLIECIAWFQSIPQLFYRLKRLRHTILKDQKKISFPSR